MQQRIRPITKSLQPPLRTIQATDNEIIILQAALHHYQDFLRDNTDLYKQAVPFIQNLSSGFMISYLRERWKGNENDLFIPYGQDRQTRLVSRIRVVRGR